VAASQTRFGTIRFRVLRDGAGAAVAPGWERASHIAEEHVPGSDRTITFLLGRGPRDVTWRVECPSIAEQQALEDAIQTTATLVLPHGTQNAPATVHDYFGDLYDHIDGVVLLDVTNVVVHREGTVRADARFRVPSP
jgi:hypothetical protein